MVRVLFEQGSQPGSGIARFALLIEGFDLLEFGTNAVVLVCLVFGGGRLFVSLGGRTGIQTLLLGFELGEKALAFVRREVVGFVDFLDGFSQDNARCICSQLACFADGIIDGNREGFAGQPGAGRCFFEQLAGWIICENGGG